MLATGSKRVSELIKEALTDEPQSAEQIHKRLAISYGGSSIPALSTIQSTLSARGPTLGMKIKDSTKKVSYTRFSATAGPSTTSMLESKPARPRLKEKKERRQDEKAETQLDARSRVDALLASPFSAFALFGLAQRGVLKKQKSNTAVREIVKIVGERWLLLSDQERKKYEAMAAEDAQRAARFRSSE
mmetsp:Transcript_21594/g.49414  ORF Transcript_21594/g.49414 Transcript_21594/m.49414 type:complete len:188 (-) Transcript_21594:131-694(-)